jgi:hypothetical protein
MVGLNLRMTCEFITSQMKTWQIFLIGIMGAAALFSIHAYESTLAGIGAVAIILAVVVGFCLQPRKEVFVLRTTTKVPDPDYPVTVEHDQIAVRVELARLWLLFIPTFAAVTFLMMTYMNGTMWRISLSDSSLVDWLDLGPYPILLFFRFLVVVVLVLLTAWISERWVVRDASVCSADFLSRYKKRIMYGFKDPFGEYFGGEGIPFGATQSQRLRTIVLYRTGKPHFNKIAMCCIFHRLVIIGRGLTDLDEATVASNSSVSKAVPQPL